MAADVGREMMVVVLLICEACVTMINNRSEMRCSG